jgi:hypothetical protein
MTIGLTTSFAAKSSLMIKNLIFYACGLGTRGGPKNHDCAWTLRVHTPRRPRLYASGRSFHQGARASGQESC